MKPLLTLFIICFFFQARAQDKIPFAPYVSPGVSFGYTIGGNINFGFEMDIGMIDGMLSNWNIHSGITLSRYWTITKGDMHRHRAISLFTESDYFDFKIGFGSVKNKSGYNNKRKCREEGLHIDLSLTRPEMYYPWLGFKIFIYNQQNWEYYNHFYRSLYLKYKYPIAKIDFTDSP